MRILVIGGTGFISSRLVQLLLDHGHEVTAITRGRSARERQTGVEWVTADRNDQEALRSTFGVRRFDAIYDMIAYKPEDSRLAVDLLCDRTDRFIHCSTISVYMVSDDVQCPVTEDQDKRPLMEHWPGNPFGMDYGILKRACEDVLWKAHEDNRVQVSMLRPTYVCGPTDPMIRDWFWIERLLDGHPVVVPGCGDHAFQLVFVDDVARAFHDLLDVPGSIGNAYNVAAEEIFSLNDYLNRLSDFLGVTPDLRHVEQEVFDELEWSIYPGADVFPFNTRRTAVFSLDRIKRDIGYQSTPFEEWMPATIAWYRNDYKRHSHGYNRRDNEVAYAMSIKSPKKSRGGKA